MLSRAYAIAPDAFTTAKIYISNEIVEKVIGAMHLHAGIQTTLLDACSKYESRTDDKAYTWLEHLWSRVDYYGLVLDALVQHGPEYVSLV